MQVLRVDMRTQPQRGLKKDSVDNIKMPVGVSGEVEFRGTSAMAGAPAREGTEARKEGCLTALCLACAALAYSRAGREECRTKGVEVRAAAAGFGCKVCWLRLFLCSSSSILQQAKAAILL